MQLHLSISVLFISVLLDDEGGGDVANDGHEEGDEDEDHRRMT